MRSVKVSTMLFSDEEPIIAHKMALMEKALSDLLEGQKTLFSLVGEKLEAPAAATSGKIPPTIAPTQSGPPEAGHLTGQPISYAHTAARAAMGNTVIHRNQNGQARAKRINSVVDSDAIEDIDDWETTAEE